MKVQYVEYGIEVYQDDEMVMFLWRNDDGSFTPQIRAEEDTEDDPYIHY